MRFPNRDFTDQYISSSYQDVLQKYSNTSSLVYILDGYGNVVYGLVTSSVGDVLITSNMTSSMTVLSASFSQVIFQQSASFASSSISASYSLTSSYVPGLPSLKSGTIFSSSFGGSPLTASVIFSIAFTSNYSLTFASTDARIFSYESKSLSGFTINSNTDILFSGSMDWQAIAFGEFN